MSPHRESVNEKEVCDLELLSASKGHDETGSELEDGKLSQHKLIHTMCLCCSMFTWVIWIKNFLVIRNNQRVIRVYIKVDTSVKQGRYEYIPRLIRV